MIIPPRLPIVKERCEKIETIGRAAISSKFYNCGCLKGKGNTALEVMKMVKVFQREELAEKGTAVKLFSISLPALSI